MGSLDLHGVRHADVTQKVVRFIEDNWDDVADTEIVTGHSIKMKGIVTAVLDEYKLAYSACVYDPNSTRVIIWGID